MPPTLQGEHMHSTINEAKKAEAISRAFVLGGYFLDAEAGTAVFLKAGKSSFISYNGKRCPISDQVAIEWVQYEDVKPAGRWKGFFTGTTQRDRLSWESHSRDDKVSYADHVDKMSYGY